MRWLAGRWSTYVDVALAAGLTLASQVEIWAPQLLPAVGEVTGSRPFLAATTLVVTLPLVLRRRFPVTVLVLAFSGLVLQGWLTTPTEGLSTLAVMLIAAYSSSAYAAPKRLIASAAAVLAGTAALGIVVGDGAFLAIVIGSAWLMGFVVGQRSGQVQQLAGDNRDLSQRLSEATRLLAEAEQRRTSNMGLQGGGELPDLSARELEVARAIATGMSNSEIAASLVISEWTVKTHVASILRKLGLRDRTQVVVAAYESGLVRPAHPDPS